MVLFLALGFVLIFEQWSIVYIPQSSQGLHEKRISLDETCWLHGCMAAWFMAHGSRLDDYTLRCALREKESAC
jgi:hypothetical protein